MGDANGTLSRCLRFLRVSGAKKKKKKVESVEVARKTKPFTLNSQQRTLVISSWKKLSMDISLLANGVMLKVFELDVNTKQQFDSLGRKTDDIVLDRVFEQHSYRLVQAVAAVVECIETGHDLAEVGDTFFLIGQRHALLEDFELGYLSVVPDAYIWVWEDQLKDRFTLPVERAWVKVFSFIADCALEGFATISKASTKMVPKSSTIQLTNERYLTRDQRRNPKAAKREAEKEARKKKKSVQAAERAKKASHSRKPPVDEDSTRMPSELESSMGESSMGESSTGESSTGESSTGEYSLSDTSFMQDFSTSGSATSFFSTTNSTLEMEQSSSTVEPSEFLQKIFKPFS